MNTSLFKYLNSLASRSDLGDQVIVFFATTFGLLIIIASAAFLFWHLGNRTKENAWLGFRRKIREIVLVIIVSLAAWVISTLLKNFFDHPRPYAILDGVTKLFSPDDPYSFPSGHATFFAALSTALYFYHRRLGLWLALAALIIGTARVISGIHFPSDILTGFGLGILVAGIVAYLRKKA